MVLLEELLQEPIAAVRKREQIALELMVKKHDGRVVLFGAGNLGQRALEKLRSIGIEPLCISDNNEHRWGSSLEGCPLLSPAEAATKYGSNAVFIVTIWNAAHWFVETSAQLRSLGCQYISSYSPIYWRFPETFLPFLLNDLPHKVYEEAKSVTEAENLWSDQTSVETYRAHILWYATGDASHLPSRPNENTYFPPEVFSVAPDEVLVDCGAFDGDTINQFIGQAANSFGAVHAIEADPLSLKKLDLSLLKLPENVRKKIHVHPCAVGAEHGTVRFEITGTVDSKICADGGIEVDCIPIDRLFEDLRISMIKMDIEGAEYDALLGATKVIQRDHPILAICVYHTQSDIWRIPLLAHEMLPEHKLFLRAYEGDGFQTVLYAIPPNRALR